MASKFETKFKQRFELELMVLNIEFHHDTNSDNYTIHKNTDKNLIKSLKNKYPLYIEYPKEWEKPTTKDSFGLAIYGLMLGLKDKASQKITPFSIKYHIQLKWRFTN